MRARFAFIVAALILAACGSGPGSPAAEPAVKTEPASPAAASTPVAAPAAEATPSGAPAGSSFSGTIAETMNAGGYTYVRLKRENDEVWVAAREFKAAVGEPLQVAVEMTMRDFQSPTLKRGFPLLYFASQVAGKGETLKPVAAPQPANTPTPMDSHSGDRGVAPSGAPAAKNPPVAKTAPPAGGLAIADVWAKRTSLSGKPVTVRGTVVKFNGGILDRNWLHIQDGSGSADKQDNDLTVTTDATAPRPQVGDVVTVSGEIGRAHV